MKKPQYNFTIDVIRVIALSGVILIHTANVIYARLDFFGGINWWIANILNSAARISVPLFLLVSGSLLLAKDTSFEPMLKRIATRLLLPLFIWTCLYALWDGKDFSLSAFSLPFLTIIFTGKIFHLYFLVILSGLYFVTPFLRSFLSQHPFSVHITLTRFLLILGALYGLLQFVLSRCSLENMFSLWIPYTGLFLAGYVFKEKLAIKTSILLAGYVTGLLITVGLNYVYYEALTKNVTLFSTPGCIAHYPDYFLSINVLLMSLCSYILLLKVPFEKLINTQGKTIIKSIANASFGMYLSHLFLIYLIDAKLHAFDYITPLWLALFLRCFVIFLLSYGLTVVAMRIPAIKYIFGAK